MLSWTAFFRCEVSQGYVSKVSTCAPFLYCDYVNARSKNVHFCASTTLVEPRNLSESACIIQPPRPLFCLYDGGMMVRLARMSQSPQCARVVPVEPLFQVFQRVGFDVVPRFTALRRHCPLCRFQVGQAHPHFCQAIGQTTRPVCFFFLPSVR